MRTRVKIKEMEFSRRWFFETASDDVPGDAMVGGDGVRGGCAVGGRGPGGGGQPVARDAPES
jgi:hypothetical protein